MSEFHTALVREKIIFQDMRASENYDGSSVTNDVVVMSNRIDLQLNKHDIREHIVVRAQNMHSALKCAARIFNVFYKLEGGLFSEGKSTDWETLWQQSLSKYEQDFNKDHIWGAVYFKGAPVFRTKSNTYMDIIEQCALAARDNYDMTGNVAETLMKKLGKDIKINQSNSVSATLHDRTEGLRCGIMHRTPRKNMVFNFSILNGTSRIDRIHHGFMMAAIFLELFNLRFFIQNKQKQLSEGHFAARSPEAKHMYAAMQRQSILNRDLISIENLYDVKYRPERPELL